jgi:3-oxoacyl-[acyl-carrier protein] reductase
MSSKHIIVTGSSKGIGRETALVLAAKGHRVTAIARSEQHLNQLQSKHPALIHALPLDITEKDAGEKLVNHLKVNKLNVDGIVHNAGLLINKPFSQLTDEDWENQHKVNLMGPVRLTRALTGHFIEGAHILCISSMGGFQGSSKFPGLSAYSATKGALSILSECLAAELADRNIKSNTLCLGAVQTEMLEQAFPGFDAPVQASEMGEYIADFLLNGHRYYNGQVLPVTLGNPG